MMRSHRRLWILPVVTPLVMLVVVLVMASILRGGPRCTRSRDSRNGDANPWERTVLGARERCGAGSASPAFPGRRNRQEEFKHTLDVLLGLNNARPPRVG